MQYRTLGRTGLQVSELGFGCGAVGGLLVRGAYPEMVRTVARAIEGGITYFDTAQLYGDGKSEQNLGAVLMELGADVIIGTKVRLRGEDLDDIEQGVIASVEGSLRRLRREQVELIQLHNSITMERDSDKGWLNLDDVAAAIRAFEKLQAQGKVQHWGINGLGDTKAIHHAVATGQAETIQTCVNLLNPSAAVAVRAGFPFQDYAQVIDQAAAQAMGVIAIRVLAAGALSGSTERHTNAAQGVAPIASGRDLADDVMRANAFTPLIEAGHVASLVEAAIRFVISQPAVSTALVGISNFEQLEQALAAAEKGPLSAAAMAQVQQIWQQM